MDTLAAQPVPWALRCVLAESPRWDGGRWWWVDAAAGLVFRSAADPREEPVEPWLVLGGRTPLVLPAGPEGMLVAHGATLRVYSVVGTTFEIEPGSDGGSAGLRDRSGPDLAGQPDATIALDDAYKPGDPRTGRLLAEMTLPPGCLLNDGIAGPVGGLFIGVVHADRDPETGYLQYVRPDGTLGSAAGGIGLSNGLALDPAGTTLFHADSTQRVVYAHELDDRGEIASSAIHLRFDKDDGMPDGLATDQAGGLWVAMYGSGQVRRFDPGGKLDLTVTVPTPQVTSVAIGGEDGRDLLITTAREGYDEERSAAEPLAGRLFSARSPYPGRPLLPVRVG